MIYRTTPDDFQVDEIPLFAPTGSGNHIYLRVKKRGVDSTAVLKAIADASGCQQQEVGMAGRKDRHAVTTQWFSVPSTSSLGDDSISVELEQRLEGVEVLESTRHEQKLRTGQLRGNRFRMVVRELAEGDRGRIERSAEEIVDAGFANRYGVQRFGRHGGNAAKGKEILSGGRGPKDRRAARFLVSALQSDVFNRTVELRQAEIGLSRIVRGDLVHIHSSGGLFWVDAEAEDQKRADALELSATGPMMGDKMRRPFGEAARWETAALSDLGLEADLFRSRRGLKLYGARRAVRAIANELEIEFDDSSARVSTELAPGCYASVLLEELCGRDIEDAKRCRLQEPKD